MFQPAMHVKKTIQESTERQKLIERYKASSIKKGNKKERERVHFQFHFSNNRGAHSNHNKRHRTPATVSETRGKGEKRAEAGGCEKVESYMRGRGWGGGDMFGRESSRLQRAQRQMKPDLKHSSLLVSFTITNTVLLLQGWFGQNEFRT